MREKYVVKVIMPSKKFTGDKSQPKTKIFKQWQSQKKCAWSNQGESDKFTTEGKNSG